MKAAHRSFDPSKTSFKSEQRRPRTKYPKTFERCGESSAASPFQTLPRTILLATRLKRRGAWDRCRPMPRTWFTTQGRHQTTSTTWMPSTLAQKRTDRATSHDDVLRQRPAAGQDDRTCRRITAGCMCGNTGRSSVLHRRLRVSDDPNGVRWHPSRQDGAWLASFAQLASSTTWYAAS